MLFRENTGGDFFTQLSLQGKIPADFLGKHLGQNVWISVEGMSHGLGMILHLGKEDGSLLEGYAVAPEDTGLINFEQVRFALVHVPWSTPGERRLTTNCGP